MSIMLSGQGPVKAHKEAKMARRRDKAIMRQVGLRLQMALRSGSLMRSLGLECISHGLTLRRTPEFALLPALERPLRRRRRSMTGDAIETYYHRGSCCPFWCLASKGGELGICLRSCVGVFVFSCLVFMFSCLVFVVLVRFRSLSFGCEQDHMV